ncbi:glutamyl-tRNA synthetase [Rhodoligotrophos appendicifer]|uniref:glutamate--tRNA ligase n=1 Tax=Rhodoligotrophos appendicifer TaxID=987056 RepID=UPI00118662D9|nr:glutamate--tRNA ligase [Rhodoligotrophos appendicifer]
MSTSVITRFAPSPTGYLHIGGARTALFNWLYARHTGGKMLLRIEDTDRERSTDQAISAIFAGLEWLGLDWDEAPVFQSKRVDRHQEVAHEMMRRGCAYFCYASQEELAEMRDKARAEGRAPRYDGRWRDRDASEAPAGVKPVIRLRAPLSGETVIDDQVQGRVVFPNSDMDDLVLLRSDGTPTYMLSVVVDDHDMAITHIIRGDDHLTNAARQSHIYAAMGWTVPSFSHIPLIHGPDGAKLSKRHGALGVEAYRDMGYLPEAMRNYLVRLGWSHGDDEIFSTEQMVEWFGLGAVGRSPARFDFAKLESINGHYIRHMDDAALLEALIAFLPHAAGGEAMLAKLDTSLRGKLLAAMPGLKERAKTLVELAANAYFLFAERPLPLNDKAAELLDDEARRLIAALVPALEALPDWEVPCLEAAVRAVAEERQVKLGKVAQPLRAALTGSNISPGIFDVLWVLGRDEALGRLRDQVVPA